VRIIALLGVRNEARFIANAIRHLHAEGVQSYVIDNESGDGTREIAASLRNEGVVGVEVLPWDGALNWAAILRRKQQLHGELGAHWYIHHDADMLLHAPAPYRTLADGIAAVDRAGDTAVDFDEFVFMPRGPADDHDHERYLETMRFYFHLAVMPEFRVIAWKNLGQPVDLLSMAGHRVLFEGRRIHPTRFILRHYLALSEAHIVRKYCTRRYRWQEMLRGWHGRRVTLRRADIGYPDPADLRELAPDNTWDRSRPLVEEPLFARAHLPLLKRPAVTRAAWAVRRQVRRVEARVPLVARLRQPGDHGHWRRAVLLPTDDALTGRPQRNLLVLGSGRSGTSMVAALFRNAGYFMGFDLLGPSRANLYGYFEDTGVTEINNLLLRRLLHWRLARLLPGLVPAAHRNPRSLWLAAPRRLPPAREPILPLVRLMSSYARKQPFCYKDPRFSVTLPLWERFLPAATGRIVVFRDPDQTADSILRDVRETYRPPLPISARWAYTAWYRGYARLLAGVERGGPAVFVHYDDVASGAALPALAAFSNARIDATQVDRSVSRAEATPSRLAIAARCRELYGALRERARRDLASQTPPGHAQSAGVRP
jgi:glycosyltransferase involved in cell wall biosynthesis